MCRVVSGGLLIGNLLLLCGLLWLSGCSAPPQITGYPVSTPDHYSENKVFFAERLSTEDQHVVPLIALEHLYEVDASDGSRAGDVISHNDPISVVLQGVRLPEDLGAARRDIAVVLDIHTSAERGLMTLVVFYQRDVPAGQMLNFNNLLVYADPQWDEVNPPYFRVRVLDVKAERNRNTDAALRKVSNLSAQIGGMVPHPAIPLVTTAIDAANLVLSNQRNEVLLDYQIQFYGSRQRDRAGGAALGPLLAGQWLVVGRRRGADASFWNSDLYVDRRTDRIMTPQEQPGGGDYANVPIPYVSVALLRADAQVPKMVLDRSETLLGLLSTPSGKSDVDAVDQAANSLLSAINAFTVERRVRKYRSVSDIQDIIRNLEKDDPPLNPAERQRLMYVLNRVTGGKVNMATAEDWIRWWSNHRMEGAEWELVEDDTAPMGIIYRPKPAEP